ncbi:DAK2 domain-containing protein [Fundicoccus ignavus]|uniref:DAK2 domain-containing protein n=1 Tax=Fundicoccus ignavus TaxID=2664442 RepID=A0A6I2GJ89_9LACT|nr:DAK2 domain-containing protein [Fundicoccus ignavus]MRI81358.1 DAK2 domain-containing protein [Fundicoccus ignavus]MRI85349.1 DAK2 domain-containing protein [Fundicoccus ignavus]MRJ48527.1 DAK2 domain-containing protein [Fundicoccus ignavus]
MELEKLTASDFQAMVIAGAERLSENVDLINSLNVFPVPDGDTGTNMNMSFQSGLENLRQSKSEHVGELAQSLAKGLLMGARGNSGVILSQIFRGFSQAIKDKETLSSEDFVAAFVGGVESAYKAVMKPVEGTILTVARESAIRGEKKAAKTEDIIEVMKSIVKGASLSLDKTPDLLPVLKQVGVVDSGGKGLLCIYEGFLAALTGEVIIDHAVEAAKSEHSHAMFEGDNETPLSMEDITYGYCTEIMVRIGQGPTVTKEFDYDEFRNLLNTKGDSLLVVNDDEIVKVHVHTENPGEIMQLGQEFGELIKIKVDNMREQVRGLEAEDQALQADKTVATPVEKKPFAIIAVAAGEGMMELFKSIGVHEVLSGGQTMNPSTEDFIKLIDQVAAENIIILPNNKNIIMAAEQAAQVTDVPTVVIPTTTIPQGISSMLAYNPSQSLEANKEAMTESSQTVISGQITYSIRDTEIDGVSIKKDDYMGLVNGKIILSEANIESSLSNTLEYIINEDMELITIIVGEDGDTELAEKVAEEIEAKYPDVEIEFVQGDQPVYHYILSAE